jgi:hypothetical protein
MVDDFTDQSDLSSLLSYCTAEWRICPKPIPWHRLWLALKSGAQARRTTHAKAMSVDEHGAAPWSRDEPPLPLILAGWWASSDIAKMAILRDQLFWAERNGVLDIADFSLRGLGRADWYCNALPSVTSSFDDMAGE